MLPNGVQGIQGREEVLARIQEFLQRKGRRPGRTNRRRGPRLPYEGTRRWGGRGTEQKGQREQGFTTYKNDSLGVDGILCA